MSSLARESKTAEQLAAFGAEWLPGEPLRQHTSLGVGGPADIIRVHDCERVPELVAFLRQRDVGWKVLGGGSNLLVADEGLREVLIHLVGGEASSFNGNRVQVPAAANLGTTVMECARRNLGGMEGLIGVPGSVGGALRMNAGAYGTEISDVVRALKLYRNSTGVVETLEAGKIRFEYRHASFPPDDVLLAVSLELPERPYEEIVERVKQCNQKRRASQPINEKSAGCIFKNPPGFSTGKMIDELGLKGTRVGGAVISERHANFIVNRHHATASDILKLMELIRARVLKAYGVELEEEVIVWRDSSAGLQPGS
jgi:UDP-N-acetylmuramate dehydrogenase